MSGGIWKNRKEVAQKRRIKKRGLRWKEAAAKWAEHKGHGGVEDFEQKRGDTHEGEEWKRDKIDWRKGKIPAGFLSGWTIQQSERRDAEPSRWSWIIKHGILQQSEVRSHVGRLLRGQRWWAWAEWWQPNIWAVSPGFCAQITVIFKGKLHLFLNTLINEATECSEDLYFNSQLL